MVLDIEKGILLTLLVVSCCVHHSLQLTSTFSTVDRPLNVQQNTEIPCGSLSKLQLDGRQMQVTGRRVVNGGEMCTISSNQIPSSIDELIEGDEIIGAAFASNLKSCEGVLLNKDMCLTQRQDDMIKQYNRLDNFHSGRWKRKALQTMSARWRGNIVPYTIADNVFSPAERRLIRDAMDTWEQGTCLTFRPATRRDRDSIRIMSGSGCYSRIGRVGGEQELSLGVGLCRTKRVIMHELGHAVGLIHEHQRDDRDSMVQILTNNVNSRFLDQFNKISGSIVDVNNVKYDYLSLMHYGKDFFSTDGRSVTIRTLDPSYQEMIGRVENLSFTDYKAVNLMYQCAARCPRTVFCVNDGYVGPNCQCVCPETDRFCNARRQPTREVTPPADQVVGPPMGDQEELFDRAPSTLMIQTPGTSPRNFVRPQVSQIRSLHGQGQTNQESRRRGSAARVVSSSNLSSLLRMILQEFPALTKTLVSNSKNQLVTRQRLPSHSPGKKVIILRRNQGARANSPISRLILSGKN